MRDQFTVEQAEFRQKLNRAYIGRPETAHDESLVELEVEISPEDEAAMEVATEEMLSRVTAR